MRGSVGYDGNGWWVSVLRARINYLLFKWWLCNLYVVVLVWFGWCLPQCNRSNLACIIHSSAAVERNPTGHGLLYQATGQQTNRNNSNQQSWWRVLLFDCCSISPIDRMYFFFFILLSCHAVCIAPSRLVAIYLALIIVFFSKMALLLMTSLLMSVLNWKEPVRRYHCVFCISLRVYFIYI